ncbi:MAG: hypothetical protein QGH47_03970 [Candidatus Woesearchaeota archaeon]|nr:hypothetical protein [Candidatus Woesearchaeota archaeon]
MEAINFFQSPEHLEPKCPKCDIKIEYDVSTTFDNRKGAHVCNSCGEILK